MSQIHLVAVGPQPVVPESQRNLPLVLLVVDGFPKALGGGERIVLRLATLLPQYGYRASILTLAIHPDSEFRPDQAPCPVYLLPLRNTYGAAALRGSLALRRFLRKEDVRIVHTFFESSDIWAGFVTRLFSRAKLVWSRRDMGILRTSKHKLAYRALRRLPHAVICVSARVSEHVITVDRVSPSKVHVVHNGLDLGDVAPSASAGKPKPLPAIVTTIGNIRRVKGHDLLVQAASEVSKRHPGTQFTVAGEVLEPAYFEELQGQIAASGLSRSFHFLGKISDLQNHLGTASIFVLPSRSEGFSNALIEAMAAGVPSIATDVGGNAEAIQNGESGLIVVPESAAALSHAISSLLDNPALGERLSAGGRAAVEERFSSAAMMRGVVHVFAKLLKP